MAAAAQLELGSGARRAGQPGPQKGQNPNAAGPLGWFSLHSAIPAVPDGSELLDPCCRGPDCHRTCVTGNQQRRSPTRFVAPVFSVATAAAAEREAGCSSLHLPGPPLATPRRGFPAMQQGSARSTPPTASVMSGGMGAAHDGAAQQLITQPRRGTRPCRFAAIQARQKPAKEPPRRVAAGGREETHWPHTCASTRRQPSAPPCPLDAALPRRRPWEASRLWRPQTASFGEPQPRLAAPRGMASSQGARGASHLCCCGAAPPPPLLRASTPYRLRALQLGRQRMRAAVRGLWRHHALALPA